jgi:hypothetical protein
MCCLQGTQAAALALWVLLSSWKHPKQAVMLAASLGGYAATTGALVGALAGALHGCSWVPKPWWDVLQEERLQAQQQQQGEDESSSMDDEGLQEGAAEAAGQQAALAGKQQGGVSGLGAAAVAVSEDDGLSTLRVGKYAVVIMGNELAEISAQQVPRLLG